MKQNCAGPCCATPHSLVVQRLRDPDPGYEGRERGASVPQDQMLLNQGVRDGPRGCGHHRSAEIEGKPLRVGKTLARWREQRDGGCRPVTVQRLFRHLRLPPPIRGHTHSIQHILLKPCPCVFSPHREDQHSCVGPLHHQAPGQESHSQQRPSYQGEDPHRGGPLL